MRLIGPFSQILPLSGLQLRGPLRDDQLQIITQGGVIRQDNLIFAIGKYSDLRKSYPSVKIKEIEGDHVLLPGFIDCHTHICFAGSRAADYAMRNEGKTYQEIASAGGGIWDSVTQTRAASEATLAALLIERANRHFNDGVTTIEVKSGYGLSVQEELKQLRAIKAANHQTKANLVATCLAAHIKPRDFAGSEKEYLQVIVNELLPVIKKEGLAQRVDIFIEKNAFDAELALDYLKQANSLGFDITIHADQFTTGASEVAVRAGAVSADHLEASGEKEIELLAGSDVVAVVLPGASVGLGMPYAPARMLIDAGACLAIASDWNPGSAPMGNLLMQAAVLGASQKLSSAEVFAGLTYRAAKALSLKDIGTLTAGLRADLQIYPTGDYREILYHQGSLRPLMNLII